ncbi:unnamed protein product [Rangifer tarandus platyrhynchus]|uniref:Uncharacterized protein n=1 Tax=Rangifer tarandus platyrhynchus TaxID=3082113 RepID=A0AC59YME6_RANTA
MPWRQLRSENSVSQISRECSLTLAPKSVNKEPFPPPIEALAHRLSAEGGRSWHFDRCPPPLALGYQPLKTSKPSFPPSSPLCWLLSCEHLDPPSVTDFGANMKLRFSRDLAPEVFPSGDPAMMTPGKPVRSLLLLAYWPQDWT